MASRCPSTLLCSSKKVLLWSLWSPVYPTITQTSKKIYCITDHTDRSTFNADAQYRKLRLEVHPDKSRAFCDRNNIPQLHEVVNPFFTQAAAALPMVHKIVINWVKGESLIPPVPAPPASKSDGDTPMSEEEYLSSSQPGGRAW
jgi:hypothetical protein